MGYNMFAYCNNNPISFADHCGNSGRLVGVGIQLELNVGTAVLGIEIIVYWDVDESDGGAPVIAVYYYGGISLDVNNAYIGSILAIVTDNSDLLIGKNGSGTAIIALAARVGDSFSISASAVAIIGNESFDSITDYEESFTSIGGSYGKMKGSIAYSDTCMAVSLGGNLKGGINLFPSWGVSKTFYELAFYYSIPNNMTSQYAAGGDAVKGGSARWNPSTSFVFN